MSVDELTPLELAERFNESLLRLNAEDRIRVMCRAIRGWCIKCGEVNKYGLSHVCGYDEDPILEDAE